MDHSPYHRHRSKSSIVVILIHGILSTPRHFDWLIPSIPDEIEVHRLLLEGHGSTVEAFSRATMKHWLSQVRDAVESTQKGGRKIILIGHSLGALLALNAAKSCAGICGLMLLNPPLTPHVRFSMVRRSLRFAFGRIHPVDPADVSCYQDLGLSLQPQPWKYLAWIPNFISLLIMAIRCRSIPAKLTVPCFAYLGEQDELVHMKSRKWLKDIPVVSLRLFPDGTHFSNTEPEKLTIQADLFDLLAQL